MDIKYLNLLFSLVVVVLGFFCIEVGGILASTKLPSHFDLPFVEDIDKSLKEIVNTSNVMINRIGEVLKKSGVTLAGIGTVYALSFCCVVVYLKRK